MFALIYDDYNHSKPKKEVISVHKSRETAEKALTKRMRALDRSIEECHTRIVWVEGSVKRGDFLTVSDFAIWRPGEKIPFGDLYSDTD
jgi:hypothetical protein